MADPPVLQAEELTVVRGDRRVLDRLNLTVPADTRLLIQGRSGAGKTTLFNVLGLLETPTSGLVRVAGRSASALPERERARVRRETVGIIFQDFQLIPDLTAYENAAVPQEHVGSRDDEWLAELFERLSLEAIQDHYPATLSGGERQRVAIARAFANRPDVILADEPTGHLDPDTTADVLQLLVDTWEATDTALVTVSHDPRLTDWFDNQLTLADGRLHNGTAPE